MPELSASSLRRIAGASEESGTNSPIISVAPSSETNPGMETGAFSASRRVIVIGFNEARVESSTFTLAGRP